jgi:hypothetical protein
METTTLAANNPSLSKPISWHAFLYSGPNVLLGDGKPHTIDRWVPFWLRWLILLAAAIVGSILSKTGWGEQLAAMMQYAALVAVSLGATFWIVVGVANLGAAALWYIPLGRLRSPSGLSFAKAVNFVNRHAGHVEALFVWLVLALILVPDLRCQLPLFWAVFLLGLAIVNMLAFTLARVMETEKPGASLWEPLSVEKLHLYRRPVIYGVTFVGLILLVVMAPSQAWKLVPLVLAILAGLVPRLILYRPQRTRRGPPDELKTVWKEFQRAQTAIARRWDAALGPLVIILFLGGIIVLSVVWKQQYDHLAESANGGPPSGACGSERGGPARAVEASLFLFADTQLHELGGKRFAGQTELADAVVPVAVRPVELDLLSAPTLRRFGELYRQRKGAPDAPPTIGWAHLGDVADLGCKNEMARIWPLFKSFGPPAGLAPGNHDSSFTGNFFWNPFWSDACHVRPVDASELGPWDVTGAPSEAGGWGGGAGAVRGQNGPLDKMETNRRLLKIIEQNQRSVARTTTPFLAAFEGRGGALVSVSPLGVIHHQGKERGLIGVFVDTADGGAFDFGVAGLFGTFSSAQERELVSAIRELQRQEKPPYDDPVYIVFAHHPFKEMVWPSSTRFERFMARLDTELAKTHPAVLALVTAHTHHADGRSFCLRNGSKSARRLREIVIGSTIDPPQEGAHLEIGLDARNAASARLTTFPAVARPGKTCGNLPVVSAAACQQRMSRLRETPACASLFERSGDPLGPDCQTLERKLSIWDRLRALRASATGFNPSEIKQAQTERASHLFSCLCRDPRDCTVPQDPLDDLQYAPVLTSLMSKPDKLEELVCLSWAASALQEHKAAGMQMADALRCAFEDEAIPAAKELVATLEVETCR